MIGDNKPKEFQIEYTIKILSEVQKQVSQKGEVPFE